MSQRIEKVQELLRQEAATYLSQNSNKQSLITVTRASVSKDLKNATVYLTVYPEDQQQIALDFCNRKGGEFKEYIKSRLKMKRIPFVTFDIDYGEKNRQRIDEISPEV